MSVKKIDIGELAFEMVKDNKARKWAVEKGIERAAHRGRALLVKKTPVDRGNMKAAWKAGDDYIYNGAPYAGIVEEGARPHKVNREGIEALTGWAGRVLGVSETEAESVAWAIAKKIEKEGQEGLFIVKDSMGDLKRFAMEEITRMLTKVGRGT